MDNTFVKDGIFTNGSVVAAFEGQPDSACYLTAMERLEEIIASNIEHKALGDEYNVLFKKLIGSLSDDQQRLLLRLEEIVAQQESLSHEIIFKKLSFSGVCQNVCQI